MRQQRLALLCAIVAGALSLAPSAEANAPAPGYQQLFAEGVASHSAKDWSRCTDRFAAAGRAEASDLRRARAYIAAAGCAAAKGDKRAAFKHLDQAAAKGYRDLQRAATNPALDPLRQDKRWAAFFEGVKARNAAHEAKLNPELARMFREDQEDRAGSHEDTEWQEVDKRDSERRRRVREIMESGGARQADDYYHAAMVFQHGLEPEDHDRAHQWCLKALELDAEHSNARWLAAASKDRALMWRGRPQLYGTQFQIVDGKWILWEVDPDVTDEERARWDVPPLAVALKRADELNARR